MQDAIWASRCLAILVRLTGADLWRDLWPVLLSMARLIRDFRRGELTPATMFQFETALDARLRELGRRIVEWVVNRLEPEERQAMPGQFLWEGEYYRRSGKSRLRNLNCLFGPVVLRRFCYQPLETCGRCLFPLELQLGIVAGVATPALADFVARAAADLTQRQLLDQLRSRQVAWGVRTLRKVTQAMAESLSVPRQEMQVQQVLRWLAAAAQQAGPRRFTLSVGRDGIMIPMIKSSKYKEACTATLSVLNRHGRRLGTVYLGQMPEAGQTTLSTELTDLLRAVLRRWDGLLPRLVYVTDCGHHPTEYFTTVLQTMRNPRHPAELLDWEWVVDYYHACQYISQLAEALFGPGRAAFAWAAKQRRVLKEQQGGIHRVLRSAGALMTIRGLVGSDDAYEKAYEYLRMRASKMDYRTYRRCRLPIGSGVTEAACKIVFTQRFKQSGMKWNLDGGSAILRLRVIALSGIWTQVRDAALRSHTMPIPVTPKRKAGETPEKLLKQAA
jgi:hypothetical protein